MPETLMSLYWPHCQLGLQCSWFIWQPSPSQEQALTLPGALEQPSSTIGTMLGMTIGSFGLDHSLGLHLLRFITK
ncbi:hypothetical protein Gohar_012613 [Gossypium harknessii]|uniref:Uncharacterized protein n=1 Tax=Gossypium harknessii TaxID=34285 RepID=A0A7J9GYZ2_9ROSI|nr:hypothetical protein [Gossypium harknessii]